MVFGTKLPPFFVLPAVVVARPLRQHRNVYVVSFTIFLQWTKAFTTIGMLPIMLEKRKIERVRLLE